MKKIKYYFSNWLLKLSIASLSFGLLLAGVILLWVITLPMPDFDAYFKERSISASTKIYDRTGKVLLYDVYGETKRTIVPLNEISPNLVNATISIEDADFYNHDGIRPTSIIRAFFANLSSGESSQGGSTLTQQVIKNTLLTKDKKISRKLKEIILALRLERSMSKDDILALYLNETPYGGTIYGAEEASLGFFGKKASELTLPEAAYLAALPQSPTVLSPYGSNRDRLEARKNLVLDRMYKLDYINKTDWEKAKSTTVTFAKQANQNIKAPHFVFYVISQLEEKYGADVIRTGGFKVITTLDWEMQKKAEEIVARRGEENAKLNAKNDAMVVMDPKTGQIWAMVGSRDYFDTDNDGNFNVATAKRQPGSSFKPFVYATAFMKGYTPDTILFDLPTEFSTGCSLNSTPLYSGATCYNPENYDSKYVGPITLRKALAQSRNIPAVKLLYLAGIDDSIRTARTLGITSLTDPKRYGLALVLGAGEVSLLEMTGAYGVFANDGVKNPTAAILKVTDPKDSTVEEFKENSQQVLNNNIARLISNVLSDNESRVPVFARNSFLYIPNYTVAAKTGTTNNYRDGWIIGYTPSVVVGVWSGNNDNSPMDKAIAGYVAAPLWNDFMKYYLTGKADEGFPSPQPIDQTIKPILRGVWQGGETYSIDTVSGQLATSNTPSETRKEKVIQSVHDILYWVDKTNPTGPKPQNPNNDPMFRLWEPPVRSWAIVNGYTDQSSAGVIPVGYDSIHTPEAGPQVVLALNKKQLFESETLSITPIIKSDQGISQVDYYINNQFITSVKNAPYSVDLNLNDVDNLKTTNQVLVVVFDGVRNKTEVTETFTTISNQ